MHLTPSSEIAERELAIRKRLRDDFEHYAAKALRIRAKDGTSTPLILNRAQKYIHARLEQQKKETGKVRALILKGRQQGCSTLIAGRFYHRTTHSRGLRTFILTHEDAATQNLFEMVNRYHDNCPPLVKPQTGASNAKELYFNRLDSGYKIGTAGTRGVGRSSTVQLFHASEAAFWPNADEHAAGIMQAVPDEPGTEVIIESTANGVGNFFHQRWRDAEAGEGDFTAIFVPWFWQEEYRKVAPPGFTLTDEELEYGEAYGLDIDQLAWRRQKISELRDAALFKQEYPATASEAFQQSGHDSYIKPELVVKARTAGRERAHEAHGPLVIGFDPAWTGADRSAMAWRRGRVLIKVEARSRLDTMASAGWCKQVLDNEDVAKLFVDVGGVGAGVYDRLIEMGYRRKVSPINFGSSPMEPALEGGGPLNRRAEIWMRSLEWLNDPAGVSIPDSDELQADACGPSYRHDSMSRLQLEKKEDMRRRGVKSPDLWDAVALTFSEYIRPPSPEEEIKDRYKRKEQRPRPRNWLAA